MLAPRMRSSVPYCELEVGGQKGHGMVRVEAPRAAAAKRPDDSAFTRSSGAQEVRSTAARFGAQVLADGDGSLAGGSCLRHHAIELPGCTS